MKKRAQRELKNLLFFSGFWSSFFEIKNEISMRVKKNSFLKIVKKHQFLLCFFKVWTYQKLKQRQQYFLHSLLEKTFLPTPKNNEKVSKIMKQIDKKRECKKRRQSIEKVMKHGVQK